MIGSYIWKKDLGHGIRKISNTIWIIIIIVFLMSYIGVLIGKGSTLVSSAASHGNKDQRSLEEDYVGFETSTGS